MNAWKWVGLAGLVGAAAVGVGIGMNAHRQARAFEDYEPDELRDRLHRRLAAARDRSSPDAERTDPVAEMTA